MVNINSASNYSLKLARMDDFNASASSRTNRSFRAEAHAQNPITVSRENYSNFASAVYGDGPYSLDHPNQRTDILAQNVDYIA